MPQNGPRSPTCRKYAAAEPGSRRSYGDSSRPAYHPWASRHNVVSDMTYPREFPVRSSHVSTHSPEQKISWFSHACAASGQMSWTGTRKCATCCPSGGASFVTTQACGVRARRAGGCDEDFVRVGNEVRYCQGIPRAAAPPQGLRTHHREPERPRREGMRHLDLAVAENDVPGRGRVRRLSPSPRRQGGCTRQACRSSAAVGPLRRDRGRWRSAGAPPVPKGP